MRIALAQIDVAWENKENTKEICNEFIKKASKNGVNLIVFPEMTLTGFSMNVNKIGEDKFETVEWFKKKSLEFNIYCVFGFVEKLKNGKGKNNLSICSPDNSEILRYSKIHPFSYGKEDKYYVSGNDLKYCSIENFKCSTFICYDLRFPEIFQAAGKKADIIIIIANWPKSRREHWVTLLKARAIETQCYIAAVNRVGEGNGLYYSGDSMVVDPYGKVVVTEKDNEKLLVCDLDINIVKTCRNEFKFKQDRKENLYYNFVKNNF